GVDVAATDPLAAGEEAGQRRRNVALAVVDPGPVGLAAVVRVAELTGRFRVPRTADGPGEEPLVPRRLGGPVDHPAATLAGIVDLIALLHERGGHQAGREQVERDHTAQGFGARQRGAIEHRERIAVAEAADVYESGADHAEARDAAQGAGDVALAGPRDLLARKD